MDADGKYILPQAVIVDGKRMPTLYEVINDDDFIPELRQKNELLIKFLDTEKMVELVNFVIQEPQFNDSPIRCFKLPYVATELLCIDNPHVISSLFEDPDFKVMG